MVMGQTQQHSIPGNTNLIASYQVNKQEGVRSTKDYIKYQLTKFPRQIRLESSSKCPLSCFPCFPSDTSVMTNIGLKPIQDVSVGDLVLTHKGRYKRVSRTMQRNYNGDLVSLRLSSCPTSVVNLTPEHPILTGYGWKEAKYLTLDDNAIIPTPENKPLDFIDLASYEFGLPNYSGRSKKPLPDDFMQTVSSLKDAGLRILTISNRLGVSRNKVYRALRYNTIPEKFVYKTQRYYDDSKIWYSNSKTKINRYIPLTDDVLFVLGLFVAEGWAQISRARPNSGSVHFAFGENEDNLVNITESVLLSFGLKPVIVHSQSVKRVRASSALLARLFRTWFGHRAYNKRIPTEILSLPNDKLHSFISGYLAGDGCIEKNGRKRAGTVSKTLIYQLKICAAKLGINAWITSGGVHGTEHIGYIQGREVKVRKYYSITFSGDFHKSKSFPRKEQSPIHFLSIDKRKYDGPVYNLEVEDDNSYVVDVIAVHNCHAHGWKNKSFPSAKGSHRELGFIPIEIVELALKEMSLWQTPPIEVVPTNFGELFVNPKWYELCLLIEQYLPKTKISLPTTGTLFDDDKLVQLASLKTLKWLNFSLNAFFAETFELIHQMPARLMPKVEEYILKFRDMRPDVVINIGMFQDSCVQSETERILFENYWRSKGFQVTVSPVSFANNPLRAPVRPVTLPCHSLFDGLVIFSDQSVACGCCFLGGPEQSPNDLVIGKFPDESLWDIWNGERLKRIAKLHNDGNRTEIEMCKGCTFA